MNTGSGKTITEEETPLTEETENNEDINTGSGKTITEEEIIIQEEKREKLREHLIKRYSSNR